MVSRATSNRTISGVDIHAHKDMEGIVIQTEANGAHIPRDDFVNLQFAIVMAIMEDEVIPFEVVNDEC